MVRHDNLQTAYDPSRLKVLRAIAWWCFKAIIALAALSAGSYFLFGNANIFGALGSVFAAGLFMTFVLKGAKGRFWSEGDKVGRVLEFLPHRLAGLQQKKIDRVLVELGADGFPLRELGLRDGKVCHKFPDTDRKSYSLFTDIPVVEAFAEHAVDAALREEFRRLWNL